MTPGFQFEIVTLGLPTCRVLYTQHFVDRYQAPDSDRPPVRRVLAEHEVQRIVTEGVQRHIARIMRKEDRASGVVRSSSTQLNVIFEAKWRGDKVAVSMTSMIITKDFQVVGARQYKLLVNPILTVEFAGAVSQAMRAVILDDIAANESDLKRDTLTEVETDYLTYWADRQGSTVYIEDAEWEDEMWECEVA